MALANPEDCANELPVHPQEQTPMSAEDSRTLMRVLNLLGILPPYTVVRHKQECVAVVLNSLRDNRTLLLKSLCHVSKMGTLVHLRQAVRAQFGIAPTNRAAVVIVWNPGQSHPVYRVLVMTLYRPSSRAVKESR